ncbi:alkaline phosphatase D family protein [Longibacter salinarum]|uniref:alkaline phosphatase D family protein n=1 Tax=Longibacter salinarum TaxID=1850348 RepID=UPI0015CF4BF0|nr:alkaline phosphatase D family protein [Longibacter salinarum]
MTALVLVITLFVLVVGCRYMHGANTPSPAVIPDSTTILWTGAVTSTTARIVAGTDYNPADVRLHIDTLSSFRSPDTIRGMPAERGRMQDDALAGIVHFDLSDLQPGTRYHYRLLARGDVLPERVGTFTTFDDGPQSFRVILGGCTETGSRHPVFDSIRVASPDLFLHLGDMHYSDIARPELERYRQAYATVHASPEQSRLFRSVPLAYMWDDHDYGPNNSSGAAEVQDIAQRAYRGLVPHYALPAGTTGTVQQAFSVGRVHFILSDLRSARTRNAAPDNASKTMMGVQQKKWFKDELLRARDAAVIIWVSSVPWIANDLQENDRWSGFTTERAELARYIDSVGVASKLVIASGDAHMVALDDGTNNVYGPGDGIRTPVVQAAALDRRGSAKGGPYTIGPYPNRFSLRGANDGQYVRMDIEDDAGDEVCVTWTGRRWAYDEQRMTDLFRWEQCFSAEEASPR